MNKTPPYWKIYPHKRSQDAVLVESNYRNNLQTISVLDGWHNQELIGGNKEGKEVAEFVAKEFPKKFLNSKIQDISKRAQETSDAINHLVLKKYPKYVSCVGAFIFKYQDKKVICSIGTINVYVFKKGKWIIPRQIKNNFLDWKKFKSGSATFFGRGEIDHDEIFSNRIDTIEIAPNDKVLIMTDGTDNIITKKLLSSIKARGQWRKFFNNLISYFDKNINNQADDATILLDI